MIEQALAPSSSCSAEDDRVQEGTVGSAVANFDIRFVRYPALSTLPATKQSLQVYNNLFSISFCSTLQLPASYFLFSVWLDTK